MALASTVLALTLATPSVADARCDERLAKVDSALAREALGPQLLSAIQTFRDDAAAECEAGNEAAANARLEAVEQMLSSASQTASRRQAVAAEAEASRDALTPDYLAGTWCATQKQNRERGLWVFAPDGRWQMGPADVNYALMSKGDMDRFWQTYDAVSRVEPDRFVVARHHYTTTFERGRGDCQPSAPRP